METDVTERIDPAGPPTADSHLDDDSIWDGTPRYLGDTTTLPPLPPPPAPAAGATAVPSSPRRGGGRRAALVGGVVAMIAAGAFVAGNRVGDHTSTSTTAAATTVARTASSAATNAAGRSAVTNGAPSTPSTASGSTATKQPTATTAPGTSAAATAPKSSSPTLAPSGLDIHQVLAKVGPSVVSIEIGQQGRNGTVRQVAAGSGVVISADGLVLTNAHVVSLTDQLGRPLANAVVQVRMSDGKLRAAKVLGAITSQDVALVKLDDTSGLVPATLGDSDALQVGDDVVAIGNALDLGATPTVTRGIISAKNRTLDVDAGLTLKGLLQTDAAINHGNSGGALVNAAGELVGIPSAGLPDAQNVGFAIPINTAKPLIEQLKNGQSETSPAPSTVAVLGITTTDTVDGVQIEGVGAGTGAERAGLQPGDIVVAADGQQVSTADELGPIIRAHKPGDTLQLEIARAGKTQTITATLGSRTG